MEDTEQDYDWDKLAQHSKEREKWDEFMKDYESRKKFQREDESDEEYRTSEGDRWARAYASYKRHLNDVPIKLHVPVKQGSEDPEKFKEQWEHLRDFVAKKGFYTSCLIKEEDMMIKYNALKKNLATAKEKPGNDE